ESVNFGLRADGSPIFAAYSQHCSGFVAPYSRVKQAQGHPIAYVALGSHANYFDELSRPTYLIRCAYKYNDATRLGRFLRAVKKVGEHDRITDQLGAGHAFGLA